jgi:hypothetical protein
MLCVLLVLMMAFLLLFFAVRPVYLMAGPQVENLRMYIREQKYIVHAGGLLKTQTGEEVIYTNSLEALINMYDAGNRICEIDIRETSDGVLVCAHGDEEN